MTTRCKFKCHSVTKFAGWGGHEFLWNYEFTAVQDGSEENKKFFAATPNGSLKVATVTSDSFEVGKDYYLDLSPAG